jgi:hypothetical protein
MRPDDIQKLLGGYATGTLTEAEQQALFAAALEDQALFDTLAREESLRDLLRDPAAKAELLASLDERPRRWAWWWRPAAALAMAGVAAIAVVIVRQRAPQPPAAIVAEVRSPQPASVAPSPASPLPRPRAQAPKQQKASNAPLPAAAPSPAADSVTLAEAPKIAQPVTGVATGAVGGVIGGVPPAPAAAPLSFTTRQNLEVAAAKASVEAVRPSARALFFGAQPARARFQAASGVQTSIAQSLGLRYTVLRKEGGDFVPADPESLKPGDEVELRFTANVNGYLSLGGAEPVALTAMQPYTTAPFPIERDEVKVVFAPQPRTEVTGAAALTTEVDGRDTYVVSALPAPAIGFTISMKRK